MSDKRFESVLDEETMSVMPYLVSDKEKEAFFNLEGCVDLLNSLSDENEKLKKERDYWKAKYEAGTETFESNLAEENEQLQSTITHLEEEIGARENDYMNLKKQFHKIPKNIREVWKE